MTGGYNISIESLPGISMSVYLYSPSFNPLCSLVNKLQPEEDFNENSTSQYIHHLDPSADYILVITTYYPNDVGFYFVEILGPGDVSSDKLSSVAEIFPCVESMLSTAGIHTISITTDTATDTTTITTSTASTTTTATTTTGTTSTSTTSTTSTSTTSTTSTSTTSTTSTSTTSTTSTSTTSTTSTSTTSTTSTSTTSTTSTSTTSTTSTTTTASKFAYDSYRLIRFVSE